MAESSLKQFLRQSTSKSLSHTTLKLLSTTVPSTTASVTQSSAAGDGERRLSVGSDIFAKGLKFGNASSKGTSSSGGSTALTPGSLAQTVIGGSMSSFLGLGTIISGFMSLLGGSQATTAPLVKYTLPGSLNKTVVVGANAIHQPGVPNGGSGQIQIGEPAKSTASLSIPTGAGQSAHPSSAQPPMNTQWFLDHSNDIAKAVKEAMLHSSSINDVIAEV